MELEPAPVVTLLNGLHVANFSSPHPFRFTDGIVLAPCEASRTEALALKAVEETYEEIINNVKVTNIVMQWTMPDFVYESLHCLQRDPSIDIVLIPLPVMECIRRRGDLHDVLSKARVVRMADRITKTIHCDRFCV